MDGMLLPIALFEVRKRLGMPSTYVYFALFFAIACLAQLAAGGAFASISVGMGAEKVRANAPYSLSVTISLISYFGLLCTAAVFGQAVHQDFEHNCHGLFFTKPVRKGSYLLGRFLGAFLIMLLIFSSIALGAAAAPLTPFVEKSLFGPLRVGAYLWPYVTAVLPNLIFTGAIFFCLATLSRRMMPVYVASVVLLIGYLMAGTLLHKIENKLLGGMLDPFGMHAAQVLTEYWTTAEKNTLLLPLRGVLLWNRLLWLGLGLLLLGVTLYRFRPVHAQAQGSDAPEAPVASATVPVVAVAPSAHPLALFWHLTRLAFQETVKNVYFLVILLCGVLFMIVAARATGSIYGTGTYPVTYEVLELVGGSFSLFVLIIITFYSGELTFRERDAGMDQMLDALPIATWMPFCAKLGALLLVQVVLLFVVMVTGLAIQTWRGYFHYELSLYLADLFGLRLIDFWLVCVLAMTVQAVVQNRYVGHFIMVLYYLSTALLNRLGLEHNLYRYAGNPGYEYSDMNGYGPFLRPVLWFDLYWAAFAMLLAILAGLLWARGLERGARHRLSLLRARFSPALLGVSALFLLGVALSGGYIFYNTNVLNHYRDSHQREAEQALYEKTYKRLGALPQPRITDVSVDMDIYPEQRSLRARGRYTLRNKTAAPIAQVFVNLPVDGLRVQRLALQDLPRPTREDRKFGWYTFDLQRPLSPGESAYLDFDLLFASAGFRNGGQATAIAGNGTFFSSDHLPAIGYVQNAELSGDNARKKYGLPPRERMADVNDLQARRNNYISQDADWVTFAARLSTSPDQIAIAPGYLTREWLEGGRRHFEYRMDARILHFFSVLSARYQVQKDRFGDIALQIYYHPGHEYDLDRMMKAMKAALAYCSSQFSPYQHRQVRIIEFPRYASFAQSFPNTIPYSESVGFIARVDPRDKEDIDYPFYVTAHEVAHQWWAHQVVGGNVQGATMLSETLAQYAALMVMKQEVGPARMKRFLKYELDRYLQGRALERKKEVPLSRVENQPYIHYNKGSLVMVALSDYLGETVLNQALAAYLRKVRYQEPPYTNSLELIEYIRQATPPDLRYLIVDLFETITLYDNRALSASCREIDGGRYEVKLKVSVKKLRAGELGAEQEVPADDLIEVGTVDDRGEAILLEKRRVRSGESEISLVVPKCPARAGIDPLNKLIDRKPDDNLVRVE